MISSLCYLSGSKGGCCRSAFDIRHSNNICFFFFFNRPDGLLKAHHGFTCISSHMFFTAFQLVRAENSFLKERVSKLEEQVHKLGDQIAAVQRHKAVLVATKETACCSSCCRDVSQWLKLVDVKKEISKMMSKDIQRWLWMTCFFFF